MVWTDFKTISHINNIMAKNGLSARPENCTLYDSFKVQYIALTEFDPEYVKFKETNELAVPSLFNILKRKGVCILI